MCASSPRSAKRRRRRRTSSVTLTIGPSQERAPEPRERAAAVPHRRGGGRWLRAGVAGEEREELREPPLQLRTRDDLVDVPEAQVRLGEAEVLGQRLARRLLHDARPGE